MSDFTKGDHLTHEEKRLACLASYSILDTSVEKDFEDLTKLAALMCGTPISLITLIDKDRQWFKSHYGLDIEQTEREISFCQHTVDGEGVLEVRDTRIDERFANNELVLGPPNIRFYAGAPLVSSDGFKLGALCVIDREPRTLTTSQIESLEILARQVITHFELKRQQMLMDQERSKLEKMVEERTVELMDINKELNTFVYKASHDIRGPLATIMGLSDLAIAKENDEEMRFYLQKIRETSNRLDQTLRGLLKVVEIKDAELKIVDFDIEELEHELKAYQEEYSNKAVDIVLDIEKKGSLSTDKEVICTILKNLMDNSVKFIQQTVNTPLVKVVIKRNEQSLLISIQDNGEGIEPGVMNRIFDMFYRGNEKSKGSGLGLYIVKQAVSKLRGKIEVKSIINQGTTFNILLPDIN